VAPGVLWAGLVSGDSTPAAIRRTGLQKPHLLLRKVRRFPDNGDLSVCILHALGQDEEPSKPPGSSRCGLPGVPAAKTCSVSQNGFSRSLSKLLQGEEKDHFTNLKSGCRMSVDDY